MEFYCSVVLLIFVKTVYHFWRIHSLVTGDYQARKLSNVYTDECKKQLGSRYEDFCETLY